MDYKCKLVEKSFNDKDGNSHKYYVLLFKLDDDTDLEVTIKSDKAKLLKLSNNVVNKDIWEDR